MYLGPSYLANYHHVLALELTTFTSLTPPLGHHLFVSFT